LEANRAYAHIQGEAERRLRVEKMLKDAQVQDEAEDRLHGAGKWGYESCGAMRCRTTSPIPAAGGPACLYVFKKMR